MGAQIAQVISFAGVPVVLTDIHQAAVQRGTDSVRRIYQTRVDKGKMTSEQLEEKMLLVTGSADWGGLKDVDLVIEAVPEDLRIKQQVFQELHATCSSGTIFASNTSALSISALGRHSGRPANMLGLHFFNPAYAMPLAEIIPGLATDTQTVDDVVGFTESIRKTPILVKECAGFLVNRLLMVYLNEAVLCLQEGNTTPDIIDREMVALGMPVGPFTLLDTIGLDISLEVARILHTSYGPRMTPASLLEQMVLHGRLGMKSAHGFYEYGETGTVELATLIQENISGTHRQETPWTPARLLMALINEAVTALQEGIASARDIDLAMVAGTGFPTEKEGPLHYADEVGLDQVLESLEDMKDSLGMRFWPAHMLRRMVDAGMTGRKAGHGFFTYP
jgi:3-hydroxyacyl-CoA dehydrogenase/enoyl-CoA hydratase/3-hydroxybutyryl-CoA epimerase